MLLKKNIKNTQLSNVITLGLGTIAAQLINIVIQPVLTRLITPEELGTYAFIINMANIMIPVASLKLTMLVVISEDNIKADRLTTTSIFTAFLISFISLLFLIIMLIVGNNIFSSIGIVILIVPLIILTNGIRFVFTSHNNREKKYKLMSKVDILREILKGIIQVFSGILGGGALGQAIGYAASPLLGLKLQSANYLEYRKRQKRFRFSDVISVYKENIRHVLYMVPAQLINSLSYALITFSIVSLFSPKEAGYYAISYMILGLPLVLISNNVGRVYLQNLSSLHQEGKSLWKNYLSFVGILSAISFTGFAILALFAPSATELIFGSGYREAGEYIKILCVMYIFRFVASSIISGYAFFNKQIMDVLFQSILVIFGLTAHGITMYFKLNIYEYLNIISFAYATIYIFIILNLGYISFKHPKNNLSKKIYQ